MPARRYPWFKLWPEALRHEKVVLLSDSAFRTWVAVMAAGSEQARRGRFASVRHIVAVTGRPEADIHELVDARLLDVSAASGEVFVHDWRDWQDKFPSDFGPRTHRNGSAIAPRSLPPEVRVKSTEEEAEAETTPRPPPQAEGEGCTGATDDDVELWRRAAEAASGDLTRSNADAMRALLPVGRGKDGGLRLRAPPEYGDLARFTNVARRALVDAGDAKGSHAVIVTG